MLKHILLYTKILTFPILPGLDSLHNDIPLEQPKPIIQEEYIYTEATFYTAFCKEGCIGITKMGHDVRNDIYVNGLRVIATDPRIIPTGSVIEVELSNGDKFKALASDTGGAIKGNIIDVLVRTEEEANYHGRKQAKIKIVGEFIE